MIRTERWLWASFALLFGLVVVAAFLPVHPIVAVFPAWGLVVLAAALGTFVVALLAAYGRGWPAESGGERA